MVGQLRRGEIRVRLSRRKRCRCRVICNLTAEERRNLALGRIAGRAGELPLRSRTRHWAGIVVGWVCSRDSDWDRDGGHCGATSTQIGADIYRWIKSEIRFLLKLLSPLACELADWKGCMNQGRRRLGEVDPRLRQWGCGVLGRRDPLACFYA